MKGMETLSKGFIFIIGVLTPYCQETKHDILCRVRKKNCSMNTTKENCFSLRTGPNFGKKIKLNLQCCILS
jgi:hypothetical protein